jgi:hypothetical protein
MASSSNNDIAQAIEKVIAAIVMWRRHGKTRGAIGFALNFSLVTFFFSRKRK